MAKRKNSDETSTLAVRPMWSGVISFGMVSVPVNLLPAARSEGVHLRSLGKRKAALRREYYNPRTGKAVHAEHIIRGYEVDKDTFVPVHADELEAMRPAASRDIDLRRFVDASEINPLLFERPYFMVPAGTSNKAYRLLAAVMEKTGKAGIAHLVMREKGYLVAILSENGILRAQTLRYHDELRTPESIGLPERHKAPPAATKAMEKAVRGLMADELDTDLLKDEHRERLMALVEKKHKAGTDVVHVHAPEEEAEGDEGPTSVHELMAALQASLKGRGQEIEAERATATAEAPPIRNYEKLSAKELTERLEKLDADDLRELLKYEREHKHRKTVEQAINQRLRAA